MARFARGIAHSAKLEAEINSILAQPIPGVVKWKHNFDRDWSSDEAIFFWVTLSDEASTREVRSKTTSAFEKLLTDNIDFQNDWDLLAYFHFRSESEQAKLQDKVYA